MFLREQSFCADGQAGLVGGFDLVHVLHIDAVQGADPRAADVLDHTGLGLDDASVASQRFFQLVQPLFTGEVDEERDPSPACGKGLGLLGDRVEPGGQGAVGFDREAEAWLGTQRVAVFHPGHKLITVGRVGGQRAGGAVVEGARTGDGSAFSGIGGGGDGVADEREFGYVGGCLGHREGVGGVG